MAGRIALAVWGLIITAAVVWAEPPPAIAPGVPASVTLQPVAIYGQDGKLLGAPDAPINVMTMPFVRASQSPFIFPLTTAPQQFLVSQPAGSNTYRAFNPCVNAHVRITSVKALEPIVSEATAYPGVRRVTSRTEAINRLTGYRFGAGAETLGSAANPMGGTDRIVSGMIVPIPGYQADLSNVTCEFELGYGRSG